VADTAKGMDEGGYARHPCLYSPKALRVRKGEDWAQNLAAAKKEKRRRRCLEEGGDPDVWVHGVSETKRGKGEAVARARDWACGGLLGSAQAGTWGEEKWAARWKGGRACL
jgi:hypothetical protein